MQTPSTPPPPPPPSSPSSYPPPAGGQSHVWRNILIGCGAFFVLVIIMGICSAAMLANNPSFRQDYYNGFCQGYTGNNPGMACPMTQQSP